MKKEPKKTEEKHNELQLQVGPFRATFLGLEVLKEPTKDECEAYFNILRHVGDATQWIIGDLLSVSKKHYGDKLYEEAARISGIEEQSLRRLKSMSELFELLHRRNNLSWTHHLEVSSLKKVEIVPDKKLPQGRMQWSNEPDKEKMQEFLSLAEKKSLSKRELRLEVETYKRNKEHEFNLHNAPQKYEIIYVDPPWKYSDELIEGYGAAIHHYPAMTIKEICQVPVRVISNDNSVLFLWVTSPMLAECWDVISSWGFEYKAQFIWDKVKHNYGHYNSVRHELLLICTRGDFLPDNSTLEDSVQEIERDGEHSEKPEQFRKIIEKMYPVGRKIELFARKKTEGWDTYGNEV